MDERRQRLEVAALALLFLAITGLTVYGFVALDWLPGLASEHGTGVDGVIGYLLITTGAIFVIGHFVLIAFLWRYGRGARARSPRTSARAERWWSVIPVISLALISEVGVLVKGLPVWEQIYGDPPDDALVVEVTAKQFEWIARYPGADGVFGRTGPTFVDNRTNPVGLDPDDPRGVDDIVLRKQLHLPIGRTANVRLVSRDVLHSFSIPAFRVKQDVVPGMVLSAMFSPTRLGRYEIACAQLCGMGHYKMGGSVTVHTSEGFEEWLEDQTGWFE